MAWMVTHSAFLLNALPLGSDGLTPWTRIKGRPFALRIVGFGETTMYKLPAKGPQHDPDGNVGTRWKTAIFLGYSWTSNSYNRACARRE